MKSRSNVPIIVSCCLGVWCTILATSLIALAAGGNQTEYIAGHRVLRFFNAVTKYGGEEKKTLFLYGTRAILHDRAGRFWIGSSSGLYSYDERGNQWVNFGEKEKKRFKYVRTIQQDKAGRIWLKSLLPETTWFDGQDWRSPEELAPPVPLPEDNRVLFTGRDGKIWFVTGRGLVAFDGKKWTSPIMPPKEIEQIYAQTPIRYRDQDEQKMAERDAEYDARQARGDSASSGNKIPKTRPEDILLASIKRGLQDRDGAIWLGARKAIVRFDERKAPGNYIRCPGNW